MLAPDSEMDDLLMQPPTLTILPACIDCCYDETLLKLDKKNTIKIKFLFYYHYFLISNPLCIVNLIDVYRND